jgi:hypothetical protein
VRVVDNNKEARQRPTQENEQSINQFSLFSPFFETAQTLLVSFPLKNVVVQASSGA